MLHKLRLFFEQLSIRKKTYLIILLPVALLLVSFSITINVMVSDLQQAVVRKNTQTLSLICTDLDSSSSTLQRVSTQILRNEYVQRYASGSSMPSDKLALQSQMSRNAYNNTYFNIPLTSGISGFIVARSGTDYTYVNSASSLPRSIYAELASYTYSHFGSVSAGSYIALEPDLYQKLDTLCFVSPVFDPESPALRAGGYLVLLVSQYNIMKSLAKYYDDEATILITDTQGNVVYSAGNISILPDLQKCTGSAGTSIQTPGGIRTLVCYNRLNGMNWTVSMQTPMSAITSQLTGYRLLFLFSVLLIVGLTFLMITIFSRSITDRLTEMTDVMGSIREGDIDCRYPVVYHDEISMIGSEFNRMIDQLQNYHINAAMQELRQREAELQALQSRINPHFLYNSLDCIRASALVSSDMRVAHQIQFLANMFRYTVSSSGVRDETVTVGAEVDHMYDYLAMISFRFEDRYFVDIDIDSRILPLSTLKLILQPVVENAFQHGVRHMASGGRVKVSGALEPERGCVLLTVTDNGVGIGPDRLRELQALLQSSPLSERKGPFMGLVNINDRIRIAYGKEYGVTVESSGSGTAVAIRFPALSPQEGGPAC